RRSYSAARRASPCGARERVCSLRLPSLLMRGVQMMRGRFLIAMLSVLMFVAAAAAPASADAPPHAAGWPGQCPLTGSMQFSPPLVNGGTKPVTVNLRLKLAKGSGFCAGAAGDGRNVAGIQLTGRGIISAPDCAEVLKFVVVGDSQFTPLNMAATIKWQMHKG